MPTNPNTHKRKAVRTLITLKAASKIAVVKKITAFKNLLLLGRVDISRDLIGIRPRWLIFAVTSSLQGRCYCKN